MPNAKRSDSAGDTGDVGALPAASSQIGEGFVTLHRHYVKSLQDAQARIQDRYQQAHSDYMRALYEAQLNSQKLQEDAYRGYMGSMQDAWGRDDAQQLARDAEQRYGADLESGQSKARVFLEEANRSMSNALQDAADEAKKACDQARLDFLRSAQEQFSRIDAQVAGADVMALIGQALLAASYYARLTQST